MARKPKVKPAFVLSKDGIERRTQRIEIRLTREEELTATEMYEEFRESVAFGLSSTDETPPEVSFADFLAILLKRQIEEYRQQL